VSAQSKKSKPTAVVFDPSQSLLKINEVAALCRVSVSCVRAWRFAHKIPFIQLNGKNLLFKRSDVDAFMERKTTPAKQTGRAA
jgi:excisionase family DNA binding protein